MTAAPATTPSPSATWSAAAAAPGERANRTLLTTIVSLDPIYCYIDASEQDYLKYTRLAASGSRPSSRDVANPECISLADESDFRHEGSMDFVDNRIDPSPGPFAVARCRTITMACWFRASSSGSG